MAKNSSKEIYLFIKLIIKTKKGKKDFYCLVTCEHVITKDMIEKKKTIYIENSYKPFTIILDKTKRLIRDYTYMKVDATLIEIFPEKLNIPKKIFLSPDRKFMNKYDTFNNLEVYIAHFPLDSELKINFFIFLELLYHEYIREVCFIYIEN